MVEKRWKKRDNLQRDDDEQGGRGTEEVVRGCTLIIINVESAGSAHGLDVGYDLEESRMIYMFWIE